MGKAGPKRIDLGQQLRYGVSGPSDEDGVLVSKREVDAIFINAGPQHDVLCGGAGDRLLVLRAVC
jgi:hypothetical protein